MTPPPKSGITPNSKYLAERALQDRPDAAQREGVDRERALVAREEAAVELDVAAELQAVVAAVVLQAEAVGAGRDRKALLLRGCSAAACSGAVGRARAGLRRRARPRPAAPFSFGLRPSVARLHRSPVGAASCSAFAPAPTGALPGRFRAGESILRHIYCINRHHEPKRRAQRRAFASRLRPVSSLRLRSTRSWRLVWSRMRAAAFLHVEEQVEEAGVARLGLDAVGELDRVAERRQRPVDAAHHLAQHHLRGRPPQPVAAFPAALARARCGRS